MGKPNRNAQFLRFILATALLGVVLAWPRPAAAEQRVALVIGNSAYPAAPLKNPLNDARAISKTLNQVGFEVLLRTNLSQKAMIEAVREFSTRLKEGDVALFYYSGHGMQVRGRNFLLPIDADIRAEDEVPYLSFDVSQVLDKLEFARSRANIVILDACRNNPFIRTFRSARVGLAQMDAPGGTLIAFSTAPGSEARDGDTELGTYTRHLVAHLTTPGLPVEIMFRRVREGVKAETKDRQTPWESSSLTGDFFFAPPVVAKPAPATPAPAPVIVQQVDPMTVELAFWDSIKASSNRADFEAYLEQYPKGRFAALARNRVKSAEQQIQLAATQAQALAKAEANARIEAERKAHAEAKAAAEMKARKEAQAREEVAASQPLAMRGAPATPAVESVRSNLPAQPQKQAAPSPLPAQPVTPEKPSAGHEKVAIAAPLSLPTPPSPTSHVLRTGDSWTYQLNEVRFNKKLATVTYEIVGGDANGIRETMRITGPAQPAMQRNLSLEPRIFEHRLSGHVTLFEFAPFLTVFSELKSGTAWPKITGAISDQSHVEWRFSGKVIGRDRVSVPAGSFDAIKIELLGALDVGAQQGSHVFGSDPVIAQQVYSIWFAPEIGRLVKYNRKTYNRVLNLRDNEEYELISYNLK